MWTTNAPFNYSDHAIKQAYVLILRFIVVILLALVLRADAELSPVVAVKSGRPSHYPIFSTHFTGQPSPFHETVAALVLKGARLQPSIVSANLWHQGMQSGNPAPDSANNTGGAGPLWNSSAAHPLSRFSCITYGKCNANGMKIHLPPEAYIQSGPDHHISVFDSALGGEIDGWGGDGNPDHACVLGAGKLNCAWGGWFPFSGNGLDQNSGNSANNAGFAFGIFLVTAQELLDGHIDHALGMNTSCLDNPDIYPADTSKKTDTSCSGGSGNGHPQYGQLVHLKNAYDVAGSAYSPECKTILTAFQQYGAYTNDTNGKWGIALQMEDGGIYPEPNPWYTTIMPEIVGYGDGSGRGVNFQWKGCLQRLSENDIEIYDVAPGS